MGYTYIRQFHCELTGDLIIVVKDTEGNEFGVDYNDYIHNYYSEQDKDEYQYKTEK